MKMKIMGKIDKKYMTDLMKILNIRKSLDVIRCALTLLSWAVCEVANGRVIVSATKDGKEPKQLSMLELNNIKEKY